MTAVVSLKEIVDGMDLQRDDATAYLNTKTGEIVIVTDEECRIVEDDDLDEEDLPDWQRENLPSVREALDSDYCLPLPDKFEIHEWAIMERFANSEPNAARRDELVDAIHGAGAFRHFRSAIRRLGIEDDWYRFRDAALQEIAKGWLEAHGVPFR